MTPVVIGEFRDGVPPPYDWHEISKALLKRKGGPCGAAHGPSPAVKDGGSALEPPPLTAS
jgi:hypothetical protein